MAFEAKKAGIGYNSSPIATFLAGINSEQRNNQPHRLYKMFYKQQYYSLSQIQAQFIKNIWNAK